jgi:hypothetical protein
MIKCISTEYYEKTIRLGTVVYICNPSTWNADAGGLQVQGQPGLHSETVSKDN